MPATARKITHAAPTQRARGVNKKTKKTNARGDRYMPIKLKQVLALHGLRQSDWQDAVIQEGGQGKGRPMSASAGTGLLNWNTWPKLTAAASIKKQTTAFLKKHKVPPAEIKTVWQEDKSEDNNYLQPVGIHKHQHKKINRSPYEDQLPEPEMLSNTAKNHFQIFKNLFIDDVNSSDDVYLSTEQQYIRAAMYQTAKLGGFLAVVGESGSGKTTLRRDLLERIRREDLQVVCIQPRTIDKTRLTAGAICEAIIRDISTERPRQSLEGKARQLEKMLTDSSRGGNAHVLIIEEAHDLNINTLKFLKRFWELEDGFKKLLSIILVGQLELKNKLDVRQHWEAREVINRCEVAELRPLNGNLEEYLALKFNRIEKNIDDIFETGAYNALRERCTIRRREGQAGESMLYPLIINLTVTRAMNLAAEMGENKVTAEIILEV